MGVAEAGEFGLVQFRRGNDAAGERQVAGGAGVRGERCFSLWATYSM